MSPAPTSTTSAADRATTMPWASRDAPGTDAPEAAAAGEPTTRAMPSDRDAAAPGDADGPDADVPADAEPRRPPATRRPTPTAPGADRLATDRARRARTRTAAKTTTRARPGGPANPETTSTMRPDRSRASAFRAPGPADEDPLGRTVSAMGNEAARVVVIGGGITGCSVALPPRRGRLDGRAARREGAR